jgi:hypothetical protein
MSQKIGYQDGIEWLVNFLKKFPLVKYRPVGDRPAALEQWYGLEKLERMLRILKDDHDAAIVSLPPPTPEPPKPPEPTYVKVAPRVAYKEGGSDARFCMFNPDGSLRPGVSRLPNGQYTDESGAKYQASGDGLEESGIRSPGPAVTGALQIDGRPYCSLPLMGDPTNNTGSWAI